MKPVFYVRIAFMARHFSTIFQFAQGKPALPAGPGTASLLSPADCLEQHA
jgi:hypothetical protein